jgi:hypothetical protein
MAPTSGYSWSAAADARAGLDEARHGLAATDQAIAAVRHQLARLREPAERERRAACGLTGGNARLMAIWAPCMAGRSLDAERRRLEHQRQARSAHLGERHVELKRREVLVERRAKRAHAARLRREQQSVDALAVLRQHRRSLPTC